MQSPRTTTHLSPCLRCHFISTTSPLLESRAEGYAISFQSCALSSQVLGGKLQVSEMPTKRLEPQPKGSRAKWSESQAAQHLQWQDWREAAEREVRLWSSVRTLGSRLGSRFRLHHFQAAFVTLGKTHNISASVSFSIR